MRAIWAARGPRARAAAAIIGVVLVAAAVLVLAQLGPWPATTPPGSATAGSTGSPAPTAPPTAAPTATQRATPRPTATATAGFDPARVSVRLTSFATVPGAPLALVNAGDGSNRLFVVDKGGRIWILVDGAPLAEPLLDISALVSNGGEQGLLGLAFHPGFPADPRLFVDYTDAAGDTVVASYRVDPSNPNRADPSSATAILGVDQPYANHNGGALAFGPDGYLYVSLGDGGSGGDPQGNGQNLATLLGKILRLDVDHPAGGAAYSIPAGNPFVGTSGARGEIWAYGLRNPWRMAFDRTTWTLWIGDVGQNAWEEVDVAPAGSGGLNFGWNRLEGTHCYPADAACTTGGTTLPVAEYGHDLGCSVIGGSVYHGSVSPALVGGYLFTDYCSGRLFVISAAGSGLRTPTEVGNGGAGLAGFGEDEAGELYAVGLDGRVLRVVPTAR